MPGLRGSGRAQRPLSAAPHGPAAAGGNEPRAAGRQGALCQAPPRPLSRWAGRGRAGPGGAGRWRRHGAARALQFGRQVPAGPGAFPSGAQPGLRLRVRSVPPGGRLGRARRGERGGLRRPGSRGVRRGRRAGLSGPRVPAGAPRVPAGPCGAERGPGRAGPDGPFVTVPGAGTPGPCVRGLCPVPRVTARPAARSLCPAWGRLQQST